MRLQSYLSRSGVASRRHAADLIREGKVRVNDELVREPGKKVDPDKDRITFEDKELSFESKAYYVFHKPMNVITTAKDTHGRKTVIDFFKHLKLRLYPVGRLDQNSTGLLLLTNDGDLANHLMHPKFGVMKRYAVLIDRPLSTQDITKFKRGIRLGSKSTAPCEMTSYGKRGGSYAYEVTLHEGQKRQIRRMIEILGKSVKGLHRFEYGSISLGKLKAGQFRTLTPKEIDSLRNVSS